MSKVLVVGRINLDIIVILEKMPDSHSKSRYRATSRVVGGTGANTAAWISSSGHHVSIAGQVGDDSDGRWCRSQLSAIGVDTQFVVCRGETLPAFCLSSGEDKRLLTPPRVGESFSAGYIGDKELKSFDLIHVAAPESQTVIGIVSRAHSLGVPITVELNGRSMDRVRAFATRAFLNSVELSQIFGLSQAEPEKIDLASILPTHGSALVITRGETGATELNAAGPVNCSAPLVEVTDRTGAGDAFDAGYLVAYLEGRNTEECLSLGVQTAQSALKVVGGFRWH